MATPPSNKDKPPKGSSSPPSPGGPPSPESPPSPGTSSPSSSSDDKKNKKQPEKRKESDDKKKASPQTGANESKSPSPDEKSDKTPDSPANKKSGAKEESSSSPSPKDPQSSLSLNSPQTSPNSSPSEPKKPTSSLSVTPDNETSSSVPKQIKRNNGYAVRKWVKNDKGQGFEFRVTNTKLYCNQTLASDQPKYYLRVQNIYYIDLPKMKILQSLKKVHNYGTIVGLLTDGTNLMVFLYSDQLQEEIYESPVNSIMPHIGFAKDKGDNQKPDQKSDQSPSPKENKSESENQSLDQSPNVQSLDKSDFALIVGVKIIIGTSNRDWYRFKGGDKVNNCGVCQLTAKQFMDDTSKKGNHKSIGIFLLLNTRLVMTDPIENKAEQNQTFFQSHSFVWLVNGILDFVVLPQAQPFPNRLSSQQLSEEAHKSVREKLELTNEDDVQALKSQDFILFLKQSSEYSWNLQVHDQLLNGKRHLTLVCPTRGKFDVKPWDVGVRIIKKLYGKPDYKSQFVDVGESGKQPASPGQSAPSPKSPSNESASEEPKKSGPNKESDSAPSPSPEASKKPDDSKKPLFGSSLSSPGDDSKKPQQNSASSPPSPSPGDGKNALSSSSPPSPSSSATVSPPSPSSSPPSPPPSSDAKPPSKPQSKTPSPPKKPPTKSK